MAYERLTALDSAFLHLERPTSPMHVGSVGIFEGAPFIDADGRLKLPGDDGQLGFGLTADRDLEPDLGLLAEAIEKAFTELEKS